MDLSQPIAVFAANRHYKNTPRRYTKEEALTVFRFARDKYLPKPRLNWGKREVRERIAERELIYEIRYRFGKSEETDPVLILYDFLYEIDDVLTESESGVVWSYCQTIQDAIRTYIDMLT